MNAKKIFVIVGVFFVLILIGKCAGKDKQEETSNAVSESTTSQPAETEKVAEVENWSYSEDTDNMTDSKTYYASNISSDLLNFKFPYNQGDNHETLTLRKKRKVTDVIIQITQGQFMTDVDGGYVRVRFDDDRPQVYSYSTASDGSTTVIFINQTNKFIKRLKTSKKLLIEAEFYQEGNVQVSYNTENLVWNH